MAKEETRKEMEEKKKLMEQQKMKRKVNFNKKKTMQQILKENRELLLGDNLSKTERYRLRRMNLIAIQDKFYDVMEKNPKIFKIPLLIHTRKAILKERKYDKNIPDFIDFEPDEKSEEIFKKSKIVIYLLY